MPTKIRVFVKKIDSRIFHFKGFLVLSDVNVQSLQQIQNVLRYENRGYGIVGAICAETTGSNADCMRHVFSHTFLADSS
jgi:hypothetical protein